MRRTRLCVAAVLIALAAALLSIPAGATAPVQTTPAVVAGAVAFLDASQQLVEDSYPSGGCALVDNGSFEVACFPGFETPDAILALAEAGQTGSAWSEAEALAAVEAVVTDGGFSGLDALDDMAEDPTLAAGTAAKLIVLTVAPLGLDPADVDPSDDSGTAVDLVAILDAGEQPDGSFGVFSDTLFAAIAEVLLGRSVPAATVDLIVAAQQADGGWNFGGDPTGTDVDPDTTGLAVQALIASPGFIGTDPPIVAALGFLAAHLQPSGAFPSPFDDGNPNSTARAIQAIAAAGYDPAESCWRDTVAPALAGSAYPSPDEYLRSQQVDDGHIASPVDDFGVNTSATSQSVHALLRVWMPLNRDEARTCAPASTTSTFSPTAIDLQPAPSSTLARTGPSRTEGHARLGITFVGVGLIALALSTAADRRRRAAR